MSIPNLKLNTQNSLINVSFLSTWKEDENVERECKPDAEQVMAMVEVAMAAPKTAANKFQHKLFSVPVVPHQVFFFGIVTTS